MRRILIICNTYFQLIVAIQLRLTLFKDEEVDVHISDHSLNAKAVADRLRRMRVFHDVCYRETKSSINSGIFQKVREFVPVCFGISEYPAYADYDEILFYNLNMPVYQVVDAAAGGSRRTIFSGMEEGVLSYGGMAYGKSPQLLDMVRTVTGYPQVKKSIEKYYCFNPELFQEQGGLFEPVCIPPVCESMGELKRVLADAFDFEPEPIGRRFVFFASSSDIDGRGFGETELVVELAELVGKDNFLVKMHPRDGRSAYKDAGLNVMSRSDIPWEVFQICGGADGVVCMAATSGSFINSATLLNNGVEGVFWRLDRPDNAALNDRMRFIESTLSALHSAGMCEGIQVVDVNDAPNALALLLERPGRNLHEEALEC